MKVRFSGFLGETFGIDKAIYMLIALLRREGTER